MHEQILLAIKNNNIPRLQQIVKVCLDNNRSIGYSLQRMNDAVDKCYSHCSQDDKELAMVILKFGGPALMEILHRAKGFPLVSTAYRFVNSKKINIESHTGIPPEKIMLDFSNKFKNETNDFMINDIMCKMDSTFGDGTRKITNCMGFVGSTVKTLMYRLIH